MNTVPKVAHIHPKYLPLSETFVHRVVANLRRYEPVILTERVQNASAFHCEDRYVVRSVGAKPGFIPKAFAKAIRLGIPWGSRYYPTHAVYSWSILSYGVKLIHAQFGPTGWSCIPLKRLHGLPLVVSFHGRDASALLQRPVWRTRYQELFEAADCVTTPSQVMAKRLEKLGCRPDKLEVVHYGLDLSEWPCRPHGFRNGSEPHEILIVGRLVEKKGTRYAIEAVAQLQKQLPVHLRIAGDGPSRAELKGLISRLGLQERVKLLGFVANSRIPALMTESDVLVMPSVTGSNGDQEGLPNVLIEAAATGLPVVATKHAGIPEIVRDGVSGMLVPERDAEALAKKLALLLRNEEMRARMGAAGRRVAEDEFDIRKSVAQLERIYDRLVRGSV